MVDTKTLALYIFLIVFIIHSEGKQINETICTPCKNSPNCSSGKCVVLNGDDGYYYESCLNATTCDYVSTTGVITMDVNTCNIDLYGAPCTDGVCLSYSGGFNMCLNTLYCNPTNQTISCGSCKNSSGCKQCMTIIYTTEGQPNQFCIDSYMSSSSFSCNYQMNIIIKSCSTDSLGGKCSCCQTVTYLAGSSIGMCISSDPYLKSLGASLKVYAKSEKSVLFSIMSLVLMAIFAFH